MLFHLLLVFRETSGDGIGCLLECSGAAPLVNNCFSLLRSVDYISIVYDSLILHNSSVENRTQRCLCVDGMLEFRSKRHTAEYVY